MAFISALLSLLSKKISDLLQLLFGWSISGLFGRLSSRKQNGLSVALILSIVWPLLLLGCFLPAVAAWAVRALEELLRSSRELEGKLGGETSAKDTAVQQVQLLTEQITTLSRQLAALDQALDVKQAAIDEQSATIANLGQRLNIALASKVEELSQYRSEFFGELRKALGDREDVRTVGDRFVFQSEVLFDSGSAEIAPGGRDQLAKLATALKEIVGKIPPELPWVLQVDGHTDRVPISTPRFPSNWELSTARAIAVAQFLIGQGIPPDRVAARGFAEFQPLDPGAGPDANRRNRRIEIKLTTR